MTNLKLVKISDFRTQKLLWDDVLKDVIEYIEFVF